MGVPVIPGKSFLRKKLKSAPKSVIPSELLPTHGISGNAGRRTIKHWTEQFKNAGKWNADPAIVIKHNGSRYILDGHHRVQAARRARVDAVFETILESDLPKYGYDNIKDVINANIHTLTDGGG